MIIVPPTPAVVTTLAELWPLTDVAQAALAVPSRTSDILDVFLLWLSNTDPTNSVTVYFETSQDGVSIDSSLTYQYTLAPGQQGSLEVGPRFTRKYWSISANSQGPSYPDANVLWGVVGIMQSALGGYER